MRADYVRQWEAEHPEHYGKEPVSQEMLFQGTDWDDLKPHLWNFLEATQSRKPVAEDAVLGTTRRWPVTWRASPISRRSRFIGTKTRTA
jgi:hypothetical protein